MAMPSVPEWLSKRQGELKPGLNQGVIYVMLEGKPQYRLDVRPNGGQFGCTVTQTVNGKRLDKDAKSTTDAEAIAGALNTLRDQLGW